MNHASVCRVAYGVALATIASSPLRAAPLAYVANAADATVSRIDTATKQVVGAPIPVGDRPEAIAVTPDGSRVYVANTWGNSISVIDTVSNAVVATISNINDPAALVFNSTGTRLFVSGGSSVEIIDTATNALVGTPIPLAPAGEQTYCPVFFGTASALDDAAMRLYVPTIGGCANSDPFHQNGRVAVVDVQAGQSLRLIEVEHFPSSVTADPSGTRLYVTNWNSGSISVIDRASGAVTGTIVLDANAVPSASVLDATGALLYVAAESGGVRVVDTTSATQVGNAIATGNQAHGIALTSDGRTAYVANEGSDTVTAIDTETRQVSASAIAVGASPVAIAIARGDLLFASGFESN